MPLRVITPPVCEPITVAKAKSHAKVTNNDEDDLIAIFIAAARTHGESLTRRAFVIQTLELTLTDFPANGGGIELPLPPFSEIVSVKYDDPLHIEQTLGTAAYIVLDASDSVPPDLYPAPDTLWPTTAGLPGSVRIQYKAGYPVTGTGTTLDPYIVALPKGLVAWLLVRVTGLYEQRENFVVGTSGNAVVPMKRDFIDCLLDPYTIPEAF